MSATRWPQSTRETLFLSRMGLLAGTLPRLAHGLCLFQDWRRQSTGKAASTGCTDPAPRAPHIGSGDCERPTGDCEHMAQGHLCNRHRNAVPKGSAAWSTGKDITLYNLGTSTTEKWVENKVPFPGPYKEKVQVLLMSFQGPRTHIKASPVSFVSRRCVLTLHPHPNPPTPPSAPQPRH